MSQGGEELRILLRAAGSALEYTVFRLCGGNSTSPLDKVSLVYADSSDRNSTYRAPFGVESVEG